MEHVLPRAVRARVAVEAASVDGWWKYVGLDGAVVGMSGFGESAPGDVLFKHFGFTVDHVVDVAEGLWKKKNQAGEGAFCKKPPPLYPTRKNFNWWGGDTEGVQEGRAFFVYCRRVP